MDKYNNLRPSLIIAPRRCILAALLASLLGASGCQLVFPVWKYRYRLSAEVERNGKIYRGSGVIEVVRDKGLTGIGARARGEAVAIDIPDSETVFVLLRGMRSGSNWPYSVPHRVFARQLGSKNMVSEDAIGKLQNMVGAKSQVPREYYPIVVRFCDMRKPESVKVLEEGCDPDKIDDVINVVNMEIEITKDPVTRGIRRVLPWLDGKPEAALNPGHSATDRTLAATLHQSDFRRD